MREAPLAVEVVGAERLVGWREEAGAPDEEPAASATALLVGSNKDEDTELTWNV